MGAGRRCSRLFSPNLECKIYKISYLRLQGEGGGANEIPDKDSCHVLVCVSKTLSELC